VVGFAEDPSGRNAEDTHFMGCLGLRNDDVKENVKNLDFLFGIHPEIAYTLSVGIVVNLSEMLKRY